MVSEELDKKIAIAHAFKLFDRCGPLRLELASDIIKKVFDIPFKDLPMYINTTQYVNFALKFWKCMCQARLERGI